MKKTGIIGAMEEEVASLKAKMTVESIREIAGMEFCEGRCVVKPDLTINMPRSILA